MKVPGPLGSLAHGWKLAVLWYRVVGPARACLVASSLVPVLFVGVAQGSDLLRRIVSAPGGGPAWGHALAMFAGLLVLGISSWGWARFLLHCSFPGTHVRSALGARADTVRRAMRRACGLIGPGGLGAGFLALGPGQEGPWRFWIGGTAGLAVVGLMWAEARIRGRRSFARFAMERSAGWALPLAMAVGFPLVWALGSGWTAFFAAGSAWIGGLLWAWYETWRRIESSRLGHPGSAIRRPAPGQPRHRSVRDIRNDPDPVARRSIAVAVGASVVVFALLTWSPVTLGERLGSPAIVLMALSTWISLGSGFIYWSHRYRVPLFVILALCVVGFSFTNDNHAVRTLDRPEPEPGPGTPDVSAALDDWHGRIAARYQPNARGKHPLYLVAAAGGGIRAAYWTATVLGRIEDEARAKGNSFADHCFAMSGVSGGALAEIAFVALVAHPPTRDGTLHGAAQRLLRDDFLSADLARFAFGDMLQRVLPRPIGFLDRARALEDAWAKPWKDTVGHDAFNDSLGDLHRVAARRGAMLPHLLLNGTSVERGCRILTSDLAIRSVRHPADGGRGEVGFHDVIPASEKLGGRAIRLSTAAHQSARFTYFSPAGLFPDGTRVVDGGYFENSGAATAAEMAALVAAKQWPDVEVCLILIDNEPLPMRAAGSPPAPGPGPEGVVAGLLPETLSPLRALLATRDARGTLSYASVTVGSGIAPANVHEFHLHARGAGHGNPTLPLGWTLSGEAMAEMGDQLLRRFDAADNPGTVSNIVASLPSPRAVVSARRAGATRVP